MTGETPPVVESGARRSLTRGATARFSAEIAWAGLALLTSSIIARNMGPSGKGTVSTLGYLVAVLAPVAGFGLGEASVTLASRDGISMSRAARASAAVLGGTSLLGAVVVLLFVLLRFEDQLDTLEGATLAAMVAVPAMAFWLYFSLLVEAEGGLVASSLIKITTSLVTVVSTAILVLWAKLAIAGAVAGMALGMVVGAVLAGGWLWREQGVNLLPGWDREFLRKALPLGRPVQASYLLYGLAARADLLLVQVVKGSASAGLYSVALTMGQLASYGAIAISVAGFPTAAALEPDDAAPFVETVGRTALATAMLSATALWLLAPALLPILFGPAFSDALWMTVILTGGGMLFALQWTVCRLWAARGQTALLASSSAATLLVMLVADSVLIPLYNAEGAAVGSVLGSAAGLAVALAGHRRNSSGRASLVAFLPRPADFARVFGIPRRALSRLR